MNRLLIALCVTAVAGAALSAVLVFRLGNSKKLLEVQLAGVTAHAAAVESQLAIATDKNQSLGQQLSALDVDLGATKSKLTLSDARNAQLARELAQTKVQLAARELASQQLAGQIASLQRDLADARAASVPPETIAAYLSTIADLERRLAEAGHGAVLAATPDAPASATAAFASRPRASILSVGPGNAFVVLNYGAARGAQAGQAFAIRRGDDTLATVFVSEVRPDFCLAQVQPDSLRGALQKGDFAVLEQ